MRVRTTVVSAVLLLAAGLLTGLLLLRAAGPLPDPGAARPASSHVSVRPASAGDRAGDPATALRLRPGERPPQFVVVSFDGAGWHEMWQHWLSIGRRVPFRFTGFLSGTYLLSDHTRAAYHPPYYPAGTAELLWNAPADLPVLVRDLNRALTAGDEIGTHFNGHFCAGAGLPSGGNTWGTADWDQELDQFFSLLRHVRDNNPGVRIPRLRLTAGDIHGERTPCLEGLPQVLFPALQRHGLVYDSSFSRDGLAWPTRSADGTWQLGMGVFPVHGRLPDGRAEVPVTAMDYNYWFTQRGASQAGVSPAGSRRDRDQVLATYRDMYDAAYRGNRAPLVLGNHFNDWNRGAYRDALTTFVLETCGRPETSCVTFSDLVAWLEAQRPAVLRHLQALPPERSRRGRTAP